MKLVYGVNQRPPVSKLIISAFQQLLAIIAATIAVPTIINNKIIENGAVPEGAVLMSPAAALFGAGIGTIVYLIFTRFKSPVFLGSSFAFIGSMTAAFAGGVSMSLGYLGLIIGAIMAGLIYVVIALVVRFVGVKWISKLMPPVVIGPTVAIIGLSLAGSAVKNMLGATDSILGGNAMFTVTQYISFTCGIITLITVVICSIYGKKNLKLFPFVIGILAGYIVASIFTVIGYLTNNESLKIINFSLFTSMKWLPDFAFISAFKGGFDYAKFGNLGSYIGAVAVAYIPVALVVFAEHIADHKNLSTIINNDLLENPGLSRTLLGDGVGSMVGAFFGGCPNTTYGESVGCVAITGNASVYTILLTACIAILSTFIAPFVTFLATIPGCVMGGICILLYGFIACSGLKMIQNIDLGDNANMFVVSTILITGVGGILIKFGSVAITNVACSLILGVIINLIVSKGRKNNKNENVETLNDDVVENENITE